MESEKRQNRLADVIKDIFKTYRADKKRALNVKKLTLCAFPLKNKSKSETLLKAKSWYSATAMQKFFEDIGIEFDISRLRKHTVYYNYAERRYAEKYAATLILEEFASFADDWVKQTYRVEESICAFGKIYHLALPPVTNDEYVEKHIDNDVSYVTAKVAAHLLNISIDEMNDYLPFFSCYRIEGKKFPQYSIRDIEKIRDIIADENAAFRTLVLTGDAQTDKKMLYALDLFDLLRSGIND